MLDENQLRVIQRKIMETNQNEALDGDELSQLNDYLMVVNGDKDEENIEKPKYIYRVPYVSRDCGVFEILSYKKLNKKKIQEKIYNNEFEKNSDVGETDYEIDEVSYEEVKE